jgi:hypothetical protein
MDKARGMHVKLLLCVAKFMREKVFSNTMSYVFNKESSLIFKDFLTCQHTQKRMRNRV